jgi:gamma-glutamyltranspeptidase / glutathione hydrolase
VAFGTPGGDPQDQWSLVFFLAHVYFGLNLEEAIDAPMFYTNHFPSSFYPRAAAPGQVAVEDRLDHEVVAARAATTSPSSTPGRWDGCPR